jgi:hypothetical protein
MKAAATSSSAPLISHNRRCERLDTASISHHPLNLRPELNDHEAKQQP